ncbi:MAG: CBS domain-containing protein [Cellvibrionaceae bacterium]|nr:CBS domain-containing protein [Cellvibrionaceae bacterium]MCV6627832.1 CBS domain-containing protein [Cellvibrionaceae bacterium]
MEKKIIPARQVMHTNYLEIDGKATVKEALALMRSNKSDVLIVDKRHDNDALGIVLLSDVVKKVLAKDKAPERVNVYEIMSKPVIPVDPDLDVRYVARMFSRFGISNSPVVENRKVIGVISYDELIFEGLCELID